MIVENKYEIGQIVYLVTDPEQVPRMVTQVIVSPTGVFYKLAQGTVDGDYYEIEISAEKTFVLT